MLCCAIICGASSPDLVTSALQQFEVLLLVGAGIGVTPFASVLADLVNRMEAERAYAASGQVTTDTERDCRRAMCMAQSPDAAELASSAHRCPAHGCPGLFAAAAPGQLVADCERPHGLPAHEASTSPRSALALRPARYDVSIACCRGRWSAPPRGAAGRRPAAAPRCAACRPGPSR